MIKSKIVILRNEGSSSDDKPPVYIAKKILHYVQDDKRNFVANKRK
jgi:hypothetical protein